MVPDTGGAVSPPNGSQDENFTQVIYLGDDPRKLGEGEGRREEKGGDKGGEVGRPPLRARSPEPLRLQNKPPPAAPWGEGAPGHLVIRLLSFVGSGGSRRVCSLSPALPLAHRQPEGQDPVACCTVRSGLWAWGAVGGHWWRLCWGLPLFS